MNYARELHLNSLENLRTNSVNNLINNKINKIRMHKITIVKSTFEIPRFFGFVVTCFVGVSKASGFTCFAYGGTPNPNRF